MGTVALERRYTPDDLLTLPEGKHCELIGGRLVEKDGGAYAGWVAGRIASLLGLCEDRGWGWVFPGTAGYQCFPQETGMVRKPDVSFIRRGRLADDRIPEGHILIPPDLAVEVISPNDRFCEVDAKVSEYLAAGVPLIWVVNPETRTVLVLRSDRSGVRLEESDELTAAKLLPGFSCRVADLFSLPAVV
jgi:Uma2 family endonuclease